MAITIRPQTPADDPRVVDILNSMYSDVPPFSLELYRHWREMEEREEGSRAEYFVATRAGAVVAMMDLVLMWDTASPNVYWGNIAVDLSHRRQGIGRRLHTLMMLRARDLGAERIYGEIREDQTDALRFFVDRGFRRSGHREQMSRLDVRSANLSRADDIRRQLDAQGIRILSLAELDRSDDFLHRLFDVEAEAARDMPASEEIVRVPNFDLWRERLAGPGRDPEWFLVALDGDLPVGLARLSLRGDCAAMNGLTGVARAYRGRGIAWGLKLRSVELARQHGIESIFTGNEASNVRMLAINTTLGYRPLPSLIEVVWDSPRAVPVSLEAPAAALANGRHILPG